MAEFKIDSSKVRARLLATMKRLDPNSPQARASAFRIGVLLVRYAQDELTKSGAVDRGLLRASMQFAIESNDQNLIVSLFPGNLPYARMVNSGGAFTPAMRRAMFASFRERGLKPRAGKGIIQGRRYRARNYLKPAVARAREQILGELFAQLVTEQGGLT